MNKMTLALFSLQSKIMRWILPILAEGDPKPIENAKSLLNAVYSYLKILATPLAVVMIGVNAYQLFIAPNDQQSKRQAKNGLITIVIAMAILLWAEEIVAMISGSLGGAK